MKYKSVIDDLVFDLSQLKKLH